MDVELVMSAREGKFSKDEAGEGWPEKSLTERDT